MPNRVADPARRVRPDPHAGKRAKAASRIIFVPWDPVIGAEWTAKSAQWNAVSRSQGKGKQFRLIHYAPGVKDGFLAAIGNDPTAVVYVRGHGSPGQRSITSKYTPPGGSELVNDALDMEEVCRRLLESGLSKTFVGTVKFYSCYSATVLAPADFQMKKADAERINAFQTEQVKQGVYKPSQIKLRELPSEKSAAKVGATYLRKKGMKHCIFYGYLGPLASEYSDDPNDFDDPTVVVPGSQSHKHVKLDDQLIGRNVTGTGSVRARDGRVQV